MTGKQVSLYIHVPFCTKKCPYCHFFVLPDSQESQSLFVDVLLQEWALEASLLQAEGDELVSIYFGGGTPSLLSPIYLEKILNAIQKGPLSISSDCEITLEANPEKTTLSTMKTMSSLGINRVSVGVQSFDEDLLNTLGRTHGGVEAKQAIHTIFDAGIPNISLDLMYELPTQTLSSFEKTLQEAANLPIQHLSLYNLTFEPGTVFYKKKDLLLPTLPSDEEALAMLDLAVDYLTKKGFTRYEISAFAKGPFLSVHNTGYWLGRPFLGLGPSAFSYLGGRRFQKTPNLKKWAEDIKKGKNSESFSEKLLPEDHQKELLAINLRLLQGVNLSVFEKQHGPLSLDLKKGVDDLITQGLLIKQNDLLLLSSEGKRFYDTVASEII